MALSGFFQSRICAVMGFVRTNPTSILPPFIFSLCLLTLNLCTPLETITPTQYLKDPETITSSDQIFKLGFFSPINSTNRYIGIWYNKIPSQTVVWVANKENPLTDSSGICTIGDDGNLVVLDGQNKVLWTTNVSGITYNTSAELLEFGNLVLRDSNNKGRILWTSLEHPSSTLIPNTRFGTDLKTGEKQVIQSWKSDSDPSHGSFFMELDLTSILQIITWNGSRRYWRSGPWNKRVFIGVHDLHSVYHHGFNAVLDDQQRKMYITLSPASSTSLVRFDLNSQGKFVENDWDEREERWIESWSAPHTDCEVYGKCGAFGNCNALKSPICSCLRGFVPKSMDEWGKGNWSGGCVRRTQLQCEKNNTIGEEVKEDGFLKLKRMKVPDFASWASAGDSYECENGCLKNCSCTAYSFDNSIGCMWWSGNLIDIAMFAKDGVDLYIRLAHSELREKNFKRFIILLVLIAGSISLSALACTFCWLKTKQRGKCRDSPQANFLEDHARGKESLELPLFDFRTIAEATNNFTNKLGEGGFGSVYKGKLLDGPEIAVKRLSRNSGQGIEEFKNELRLISKLQHRNLVRLLGFCIAGEEKILLYEYMAHKSLDAFLFDPTRRVLLDWSKRFSIVDGIARGLLYLHRDSRLRVIHRDLKTSNILLDEDMNPKISDFGMARIFGGKQTLAKTKRVVGTYGYMSPEYAMRGIFSEKSDVFSFGVLLLEIVSSKRNTSLSHNEHSLYLLEYAWRLWNENKALELMDPSLVDTYSPIELMRCIHIGLLCVQEHAIDRPNMSTVVFMLGSETTLPTPKQPAFTLERIQTSSNSPSNTSGMVSINTVTTMSVEGR